MALLNDRIYKELQFLASRDFTPASVLAKHFGVSERTIRTDISAINHSSDTGVTIRIKRKKGYYLVTERQKIHAQERARVRGTPLTTELHLDSKKQRRRYVIRLLLFSDVPISFSQLAAAAYIEEDTVKTYMRQIRETLATYHLHYLAHRSDGILLYGEELDRRTCFLNECIDRERFTYITSFDAMERESCASVDLTRVQDIVFAALSHAHITASDRDYKDIVLCVGLGASRIQSRHFIRQGNGEHDSSSALMTTDSISNQLETLVHNPLDEAERDYIYQLILAHTNASTDAVDPQTLKQDVQALLDVAYENYNIDLRQDQTLKDNLFKHLGMTLSNRERESHSLNPLLETIKRSYPFPYDVALAATEVVFTEKPYSLTENEIGYIALHIGTAMERTRDAHQKRCHVVLVCSKGASVQQFFSQRIEALFGEDIHISANVTYQEFTQLDHSSVTWDLIISTVPLDTSSLEQPYLLVNWTFPTHDIQAISRYAMRINDRWTNDIVDVFDERYFVRIERAITRDQLLEFMCSKLVSSGVAESSLFDQVNHREDIADTAITNLQAIPHPLVPCTTKMKIFVAILRNPITRSKTHDHVRIVMLLAIKPSKSSQLEEFYDLLTEIVSNENLQKHLFHVTTYGEFIEMIRKLSLA